MGEDKMFKVIGWLLIVFGALIVIFARFAGIDLTEGQLFVEFCPWWLLAIGSLLGGVIIIKKK